MPDREKVIRAIELEIKHENTWECREKCPYYGKTDCNCFTQVLVDALELLKEQEPVKPIDQGDDSYACDNCGETVGWDEDDSYICDACGKTVGLDEMECYEIGPIRYKYCPGCGRKVKWNG